MYIFIYINMYTQTNMYYIYVFAVAYPGLLRAGVNMAGDSEPIKGFGGLPLIGSRGKAPVGDMGTKFPKS